MADPIDPVDEYYHLVTLDEFKTYHRGLINQRTTELILQGFVFDATVFSLDRQAQVDLTALWSARSDPAVTYPVEYSTKTGATYQIQDSDDLHNMGLAALGTMQAHRSSGRALKGQINAASTIAEVLAVEDNR